MKAKKIAKTKNGKTATIDTLAKHVATLAGRFDTFTELMMGEFHELREGQERIEVRVGRLEGQMTDVLERVRSLQSDMADVFRRLDRLEEQGASNAGFAKEIDELRTRMNAMQKEIDRLSEERTRA